MKGFFRGATDIDISTDIDMDIDSDMADSVQSRERGVLEKKFRVLLSVDIKPVHS